MKIKHMLTLLLLSLLAACVFSVQAFAETETTTYVDEYGNEQTVEATVLAHTSNIYGDTVERLDAGWYVVKGNMTFDRIITRIDVKLILSDGCTLNAPVLVVKKLTIYGQKQGTGKLIANAENYSGAEAGIDVRGGDTLIINGGIIEARGDNGSGIGSICLDDASAFDYENVSGDIIINGGDVTAIGGAWCSGIGGNRFADEGSVTINGGVVRATGGVDGAGIGVSESGTFGNITINGGTVIAKSGVGWGRAIGAEYYRDGCNFTIGGNMILRVDDKDIYFAAQGNDLPLGGFMHDNYSSVTIWDTSKDVEIVKDGVKTTVRAMNLSSYLGINFENTFTMANGYYYVEGDVSYSDSIGTVPQNIIYETLWAPHQKGNPSLILCDGCKLTINAPAGKPGIDVYKGRTLTIYGQSAGTGMLNITGGSGAAGIVLGENSGLHVCGGMLYITGDANGSGISGGNSSLYIDSSMDVFLNGNYYQNGLGSSENMLSEVQGNSRVEMRSFSVIVTDSDGNKTAYDTLQEAYDAAGTNTITLWADISVSQFTVAADRTVYIDMNGYTITGDETGSTIINNGTLTLYGDGTITGGLAENGGNIYNTGTLNLCYTGTITGGKANNGGNIYNAGTCNIKSDLTISGGSAENGGNIYNAGTLTQSNSTISDGRATKGGNIYNNDTLVVDIGKITGGTAEEGGNVYNSGNFTSNYAKISNGSSVKGGGVYNAGSLTLAIKKYSSFKYLGYGQIADNSADESGGGVYNTPEASLRYIAGEFSGNTAAGETNNIAYYSATTLNMEGGTVEYMTVTEAIVTVTDASGNTTYYSSLQDASEAEGEYTVNVYADLEKANFSVGVNETATLNLNGHTITAPKTNRAIQNAGTLTICGGGTITGGSAEKGGTIYNSGYLEVENCTIANGNASNAGGNIYNYVTLILRDCTVSGGSATNGGNIYNAGELTIYDGEISDGSATMGGGVYNTGYLTCNETKIKNNTATEGGGGILNVEDAPCTYSKDAFSGNLANGQVSTIAHLYNDAIFEVAIYDQDGLGEDSDAEDSDVEDPDAENPVEPLGIETEDPEVKVAGIAEPEVEDLELEETEPTETETEESESEETETETEESEPTETETEEPYSEATALEDGIDPELRAQIDETDEQTEETAEEEISQTGSAFSGASLWIILGGAVVILAGIAAAVIGTKRKNKKEKSNSLIENK